MLGFRGGESPKTAARMRGHAALAIEGLDDHAPASPGMRGSGA